MWHLNSAKYAGFGIILSVLTTFWLRTQYRSISKFYTQFFYLQFFKMAFRYSRVLSPPPPPPLIMCLVDGNDDRYQEVDGHYDVFNVELWLDYNDEAWWTVTDNN